MKNSVRISVIIPVYNMARLMRRALDSLVDQSYQDYEVILINDGSTDESPSICDEYASRYSNFRVIHKPNGGVSSARNAGLEVAEGEWIAFCDPDDLPDKEWLANYDVDNAGNAEIISQGFRADKKAFGPLRDQDTVCFEYDGDAIGLSDNLLENNSLGYPWSKLFRTHIIRENNLKFDVNMRMREDEIFLLNYLPYVKRAICRHKTGYFYFVPEWGGKYGLKFNDECYINDQADRAMDKLMTCGDFRNLKNFYIDSRNYNLMLEFEKTLNRKYLRQIRELISKYPDSTRLMPYLKKIIYLDRTMTISWMALFCHMKLKKVLAR